MSSKTFQPYKKYAVYAAVIALLSVALGAFGAHALKESLAESGHTETWKTAVQYAMFHALAILLLCLFQERQLLSQIVGNWALRFWTIGIILFSGSLFGLSLELGSWLGPITPLGGLSFMIGWLLIVIGLLKAE